MKTIFKSLLVLIASLWVVSATTSLALAWNPFGDPQDIDCTSKEAIAAGRDKSAICAGRSSTANPLIGPNGLLIKATHIIAIIAGSAAVIMILVGAFRFVTSGSDISSYTQSDEDVKKAKKTIANALIGLVVIVVAQAIISFVLSRI